MWRRCCGIALLALLGAIETCARIVYEDISNPDRGVHGFAITVTLARAGGHEAPGQAHSQAVMDSIYEDALAGTASSTHRVVVAATTQPPGRLAAAEAQQPTCLLDVLFETFKYQATAAPELEVVHETVAFGAEVAAAAGDDGMPEDVANDELAGWGEASRGQALEEDPCMLVECDDEEPLEGDDEEALGGGEEEEVVRGDLVITDDEKEIRARAAALIDDIAAEILAGAERPPDVAVVWDPAGLLVEAFSQSTGVERPAGRSVLQRLQAWFAVGRDDTQDQFLHGMLLLAAVVLCGLSPLVVALAVVLGRGVRARMGWGADELEDAEAVGEFYQPLKSSDERKGQRGDEFAI